ncbi:MAG: signal peptidase I [Candidatus Longimicrobiales bacterium M2_2A_002]
MTTDPEPQVDEGTDAADGDGPDTWLSPTASRRSSVASVGRWTWEWIKSLVIALTLFLVIRAFVVEAFRIPTASMENTLLVGDFLLVNKAVYGAQVPGTSVRLPAFGAPERGDVVVFTPPHDPARNYVKRLVGVAGDTLAMRDKILFRNGDPVREDYVVYGDPLDSHAPSMGWQADYLVDPGNRIRYRPTRDNWGPLVVPEGRYFVLGDNRDDSEDSRYWGFVEEASIKGKPLFVYYSFNPRTRDQVPWLTEIRWDRIGGVVH